MDGKIIVYGICLVIIVAGASLWSYTMEIDDAEKELALARHQLVAAQDGVRNAQGWIHARKEALALITAGGILEKENQVLRDQVGVLRQRLNEVNGLFGTAIQRGRDLIIGAVIPEVALSNGVVLRQVRVQSADPELAVLLHSGGVSKVSTAILPADMLDRFRFGTFPGQVGGEAPVMEPSFSGGPPPAAPIKPGTSASDSLVRLGMDGNVSSKDAGRKKALPAAPRDPERIKREGDPALWKSVERTSIGRAYIPGQGWLRVGADGPIPGSARK
ncbi:MAG: hypothetical protein CJBNEKGG_02954 [Prosthecobacter sp.]|nr:hypothetical protein [Prosthecobacter sp.]